LFSTFANGWPGAGLLLLRLVTGIALIDLTAMHHSEHTGVASLVQEILGIGAGTLLIAGLWTPIIATLTAIVAVWILFSNSGSPLVPILLAVLGVSLALIGPGAWSMDARLFGRKQIKISDR
jgi:putative oxidoreductase